MHISIPEELKQEFVEYCKEHSFQTSELVRTLIRLELKLAKQQKEKEVASAS